MSLENSIEKFIEKQKEPSIIKNIEEQEALTPEQIISGEVETEDFDLNKINDEDVNLEQLEQPHKEIIPTDPAKEAKTAVSLIDMTQRLAFTAGLKYKGTKKAGGKESWNTAINKLEDLEDGTTQKSDLTPEELKNYAIVKRTQAKIKRLPLTSDEREIWEDALKDIIKENGYKMPPSALITIACINMLVPRLTDLMLD